MKTQKPTQQVIVTIIKAILQIGALILAFFEGKEQILTNSLF